MSSTTNTIHLADKEPVEMKYMNTHKLGDGLMSLSYQQRYGLKTQPKVWAVSDSIEVVGKGGLADSILTAYSYHRTLVLRPDDFWLHIAQQVGTHIVTNSEAYRSHFVDHQGKKEINVYIDEAVAAYGLYDFRTWEVGVDKITSNLADLVKQNTADIFVNKFSTTTPVVTTANKIILMNAMKNYFSYKMSTECGIPNVEMKGTRDDWVQLIEKVKKLDELVGAVDDATVKNQVTNWFKNLYPVLDNLLVTHDYNTASLTNKLLTGLGIKTNIKEWWGHVADEKTTYGSGGTTRYYGWITKLFLYNSQGKIFTHRDNEIDDFPSGVCVCPFIFNDNGKPYQLNLISGHCGSEIRSSDGAVIPAIGWAVADQVKESAQKSYYDFE